MRTERFDKPIADFATSIGAALERIAAGFEEVVLPGVVVVSVVATRPQVRSCVLCVS